MVTADENSTRNHDRLERMYKDAVQAGWASTGCVVLPLLFLAVFPAVIGVSSTAAWAVLWVGGLMLLIGAPLGAILTLTLVVRLKLGGRRGLWKPLLLALPGVFISTMVTLHHVFGIALWP